MGAVVRWNIRHNIRHNPIVPLRTPRVGLEKRQPAAAGMPRVGQEKQLRELLMAAVGRLYIRHNRIVPARIPRLLPKQQPMAAGMAQPPFSLLPSSALLPAKGSSVR